MRISQGTGTGRAVTGGTGPVAGVVQAPPPWCIRLGPVPNGWFVCARLPRALRALLPLTAPMRAPRTQPPCAPALPRVAFGLRRPLCSGTPPRRARAASGWRLRGARQPRRSAVWCAPGRCHHARVALRPRDPRVAARLAGTRGLRARASSRAWGSPGAGARLLPTDPPRRPGCRPWVARDAVEGALPSGAHRARARGTAPCQGPERTVAPCRHGGTGRLPGRRPRRRAAHPSVVGSRR